MGRKSNKVYETMTPTERTNRAKLAAYRRWYNPKRGSIERAETTLRQLAAMLYEAAEAKDQERILRIFNSQLSWEKWHFYLKNNKNGAMELDVDPVQAETEMKLLAARKRREKALGSSDEGEGVAEMGESEDSGEDGGDG